MQRGQDLRATAAKARFAGGVEPVLDIALLRPFQRERRAGAVAQHSLQPRPIGGLDADPSVHRKLAAVCPLRHVVRVINLVQTAAHQALQESPLHPGPHRSDGRLVDRGAGWNTTSPVGADANTPSSTTQ